METANWIQILTTVAVLAGTLIATLFAWILRRLDKLNDKIYRDFLHLDEKISQTRREVQSETRKIRDQVQSTIQMISDRRQTREITEEPTDY